MVSDLVIRGCSCKEWKQNITELNDVLTYLLVVRGYVFKGAPFLYCPWCGKKLEEDLDKEGML